MADCPICGAETTLFIRPKAQVRAVMQPVPASIVLVEQPSIKKDYTGLGAVGLICSFFLPLIGFFIGIYLLAKGESGRGCACMAISIVCGVVWLAILNS